MLIKFRIWGNLRFLSHAETLKLFQRACVRAGIKTAYSQGFNPRPKLSLPLPRSVGVETDDDLLCLRLQSWQQADNQSGNSAISFDIERLKARLTDQLPQGCELLSVSVSKADTSPQPCLAKYALTPRLTGNEKLKTTIKRLLTSKTLNLDRQIDAKGHLRNIDVRGFLKSIEFDGTNVTVECKITSAGSIRIEEILKLLELDVEKLAAPVRRVSVQWREA